MRYLVVSFLLVVLALAAAEHHSLDEVYNLVEKTMGKKAKVKAKAKAKTGATPSPSTASTCPSSDVTQGLTSDEISKMTATSSCGAYVIFESETINGVEYHKIRTPSSPDHWWGCVNPNAPSSSGQEYVYYVPKSPSKAASPHCVGYGDIGTAKNGVSFFHALAGGYVNAVEGTTTELMDCCDGHSTQNGRYHYHKLPSGGAACNKPVHDASDTGPQFLGVAFDGFPIYSSWDGMDESSLDGCHGTCSVPGLGGRYAYVAVEGHFPYTLGCFMGDPTGELGSADAGVDCSSTGTGQMCSCDQLNGKYILDKSDVTTDGKKRSEVEALQEVLDELFERASKKRVRRSSKTRMSHKRQSNVVDCHSDTCDGGNFYLDGNGNCVRGN